LTADRVLPQIDRWIAEADAVITIVSGFHPNVFFESGLAAGAGKPLLLVAPRDLPLPSILEGFPLVVTTEDLWIDAETVANRALEMASIQGSYRFGAPEHEPTYFEFEELVSRILAERGFDVSRPDSSRDAGYDLLAIPSEGGQRILVEVKYWPAQMRVPLGVVRSLSSAIQRHEEAVGMVVSTTPFTPAALELAAQSRILLKTFDELTRAQSVEDVLRSTAIQSVPISTSKMPSLLFGVGSEQIWLGVDTGSDYSFGNEADFVARGLVPRVETDGAEYHLLMLGVAGERVQVMVRQISLQSTVISQEGSVLANLSMYLVHDWGHSPFKGLSGSGFVGRNFFIENSLVLSLSANAARVDRAAEGTRAWE
jgi:hypothetical protein